MKVITWNTRSAPFARIAPIVHRYLPDLLVLAEVPKPTRADLDLLGVAPDNHRWRGSMAHKGLGVFTFNEYTVVGDGPRQPPVPAGYQVGRDPDADRSIRPWVLPVEVSLPTDLVLRFVGTWASNRKDFRPLTVALEEWEDWLSGGPVIVAGDFNHHRKWDRKRRAETDVRNHAYMERLLFDRHNLVSVYHHALRGANGEPAKEVPTFWQSFDQAKPHHIDYVYAPAPCVGPDPADVEVGTWDHYAAPGHRLSDHAPLICDIWTPQVSTISVETQRQHGRSGFTVHPYHYREPPLAKAARSRWSG